jgi:hypothetical protein
VPGDDREHLSLEVVGFALPGRIARVTATHRVVEVVQDPRMQQDPRETVKT